MFLPDNTHRFCTSRFYVLAKTQGAQRETPKMKNKRTQTILQTTKNGHGRVRSVIRVLAPDVKKADSTIH